MKFKNDKERIEFLEARRAQDGWYTWKRDPDLGRIWQRRDFDGCTFVVEMRLRTVQWPKVSIEWSTANWYIITDWKKPFEDYRASRSLALAKLKEMQREGTCK